MRAILTGQDCVVHVRITQVMGSAPREVGAQMLVTATAQAGTIGGGQAEYRAVALARQMLADRSGTATLDLPLGPEIGQCCGGRIVIALELLDDAGRALCLAALDAEDLPTVLILGAGHVGRALARVLATQPCRIALVDSRETELAQAPDGVVTRLTPLPEAEILQAPTASAYVIATHDHGLDFLLTLAALHRKDAAYVGLIGSATKRARFARFALQTDGLTDLRRLTCPIGAQGLGDKRPEVIALMCAQEITLALAHARTHMPLRIAQS